MLSDPFDPASSSSDRGPSSASASAAAGGGTVDWNASTEGCAGLVSDSTSGWPAGLDFVGFPAGFVAKAVDLRAVFSCSRDGIGSSSECDPDLGAGVTGLTAALADDAGLLVEISPGSESSVSSASCFVVFFAGWGGFCP